MKLGSRRTLLGGLTVLLPAAGIAYLGAVSYQEDRGIVAAKLDELSAGAERVATAVERDLSATESRVAETFRNADSGPQGTEKMRAALRKLAAEMPLAAYPFQIDRNGRLRYPAERPLSAGDPGMEAASFLSRGTRTCPERGFDSCVRAIRAARKRTALLAAARRSELGVCRGTQPVCTTTERSTTEARRALANLARHDDTGPEAVLGLARIAASREEWTVAERYYRELGTRFGHRADEEGVPYQLLADLGLVEIEDTPVARLELYRKLIGREYRAPSSALAYVADRLRARLRDSRLDAAQQAQLVHLDARLAAANAEARLAASLVGELQEVAHTAEAQLRGRPARGSQRTIVYRAEPDGTVVGVVVDRGMLAAVASHVAIDLDALAQGARVVVDREGEHRRRRGATRTLASAGFGAPLPHLALSLVNDRSQPDPLDEIVRARGRRHLAITGALVALLLVGLVATLRGAARERELARLKSEFVSTVSHELKTPLTSIRMFAEMLQQDVAGRDRAREERYHEIIVRESERLGLLIANVLDYSQIERGTRRYNKQRERAADVVRESIETFQRFQEEQPSIHYRAAEDAKDAHILVDREVVVQALLNLLANAAKYGGSEHPIEARVELRGDDRVALSVRDRGPGIPRAEQSRIFREFYRTSGAYRSGVEGTGLGLALVKRHVEAQGGEVGLDSTVGVGSTFSLVFEKVN